MVEDDGKPKVLTVQEQIEERKRRLEERKAQAEEAQRKVEETKANIYKKMAYVNWGITLIVFLTLGVGAWFLTGESGARSLAKRGMFLVTQTGTNSDFPVFIQDGLREAYLRDFEPNTPVSLHGIFLGGYTYKVQFRGQWEYWVEVGDGKVLIRAPQTQSQWTLTIPSWLQGASDPDRHFP